MNSVKQDIVLLKPTQQYMFQATAVLLHTYVFLRNPTTCKQNENNNFAEKKRRRETPKTALSAVNYRRSEPKTGLLR
jgi:hypothetical protein